MTIGERIKTKRIEKDLSQTELAKLAGYYDKTVISRFEHAENDISMKQVKRIAKALNVSPAYLMGWEEAEIQAVTDPDRLEAERLYDLYTKATPEVQQAVELMLKSSQPKS